jgi:hypothetical protein
MWWIFGLRNSEAGDKNGSSPCRNKGSAPNKMTAKTKTYLLVVPTYGCPYIHAETPTKKEDRAEMISTLVGGFVERIPFNYYMVHPMFCDPAGSSHHTRWNLVRQLLTSKHVTVYGNENGMYECCPNMALIAKGSLLIEGGQPMPGFGDEVMEVSEAVLTTLGWKPDDLAYVKVDEDDEEEA